MLGQPRRGLCLLCGQVVPGWEASVLRARAILSAAMSDAPDLPDPDEPLEPADPDDGGDAPAGAPADDDL